MKYITFDINQIMFVSKNSIFRELQLWKLGGNLIMAEVIEKIDVHFILM